MFNKISKLIEQIKYKFNYDKQITGLLIFAVIYAIVLFAFTYLSK